MAFARCAAGGEPCVAAASSSYDTNRRSLSQAPQSFAHATGRWLLHARRTTPLHALARPEPEGSEDIVAPEPKDWDDCVEDWWSFWEDEQEAVAAFDESEDLDDEHDTVVDKQKSRRMAAALLDRLPLLQDNPAFVGVLPVPYRDRSLLNKLPDPGPRQLENPGWDEWALRAWMEKRRAAERAQAAWDAKRAEVGKHSYIAPSWKNDVRLAGKDEREWSHEEILALITQNGLAADPANVPLLVEDPDGRADYVAQGVKYILETEEYLQDIGHWMENVSQEELDKEVTLLASEFADFEDGPASLPVSVSMGDEGDSVQRPDVNM